jgi:hypothetical protein
MEAVRRGRKNGAIQAAALALLHRICTLLL